MRNFQSPMSHIMRQYAHYFTDATVFGSLYEVAGYPGLIPDSTTSTLVYGEVFQVNDKRKLFDALDEYEQCSERFLQPNEYERLKMSATLRNNQTVDTWVYAYNHPVDKLKHIRSGCYKSYIYGQ